MLLTACARTETDPTETVRTHFAGLTGAQAEVKILSDLGDSTLEYTVHYEYNKEAPDFLTVLQPESIADISLTITGETADALTLTYEGTSLDCGGLEVPGMTPADALPCLMAVLAGQTPSAVGQDTIGEREAISLTYDTPDSTPVLERTVWIDRETLAPLCAELYVDGAKVLTLFFSQYTASEDEVT